MTEQEKETKKHREEAIEALKEMRDVMMNDDNWEHMMRLIDAVTLGAFAIARLNEIDYGAESEPQEREGHMNCEDCDYTDIADWEQDKKTGKAKPVYWCERYRELCSSISKCQYKAESEE